MKRGSVGRSHVHRSGEGMTIKEKLTCPNCGEVVETYKNPLPTVDIIIKVEGGILLIKRKNSPFGWALPGGFVDYGESLESAAIREAKEETSLEIEIVSHLGVYSDPKRDPRHHTITNVFIAKAMGIPVAADDAAEIGVFSQADIPPELAFDHDRILQDFFNRCQPEK